MSSAETRALLRIDQPSVELAETNSAVSTSVGRPASTCFTLIEPDENKLSDILADPLDPKAIHGQDDLFLRLLFKQLGLGSDSKLTKNATVHGKPQHGI